MAFGLAPMTSAPVARADGFDEIMDLALADMVNVADPGANDVFSGLGLGGLDSSSGLGGFDDIFAALPGSAAGGGTDFLSDAYTALYNALSNTISPIFQTVFGPIGQIIFPINPDLTPGYDWSADPFAGLGQYLSILETQMHDLFHDGAQDFIINNQSWLDP
ncbi:hypothetical protein, partial [[Mycobacterium] nativiensis]